MMITAAQLRAARGLLDWTRADLAKAANISPETVKNIEHGTFRPQENTADAIVKAFGAHDVKFTENEGVQIKQELVRTFVGKEGYIDFLIDIYKTVKNGGQICQFNFSDSLFVKYSRGRADNHTHDMSVIPNLNARCLVPEGDYNFPAKYCVYKWLKKEHLNAIPYYLYGNNVAMLTNEEEEQITWVVIGSTSLVQAFRKQFDMYWEEALAVPASKVG